MNYGLITKIPPATILSSNPALAQFANMSFGSGNFSNLTNVLAASMAASIGMQNALTTSDVGGMIPPGVGGGGGGGGPNPMSMMRNNFDYEPGILNQPPQHQHQQQQHHHMSHTQNSTGSSQYHHGGHQQRKVTKR
jgi:hypothetical protein